eukprot:184598-Amphidinium_carterae.1
MRPLPDGVRNCSFLHWYCNIATVQAHAFPPKWAHLPPKPSVRHVQCGRLVRPLQTLPPGWAGGSQEEVLGRGRARLSISSTVCVRVAGLEAFL